MNVIIDSREQERANRAAEYFLNHDCEVAIAELTVGDYLFNNQTVFEYKRIDDFFSSLNDKRLWNQAIDQYESYDYHYVVVEKNREVLNGLIRRWGFKNIGKYNEMYDGMVAALNVFTTVIEKENESQCFKSMLKTAEKVSKNRLLVKKPEIKTANPAQNWLTMIKGVGVETASLVTDEYDLKYLKDLLFLDKKDLTEIKGIGEKTARLILSSIK